MFDEYFCIVDKNAHANGNANVNIRGSASNVNDAKMHIETLVQDNRDRNSGDNWNRDRNSGGNYRDRNSGDNYRDRNSGNDWNRERNTGDDSNRNSSQQESSTVMQIDSTKGRKNGLS